MSIKPDSILAELATRFARSPEDLATEGLAYSLRRSVAGKKLVENLLARWLPTATRPVAAFRTQVSEDDSRPDLVAFDEVGSPILIFENKFWAALTDAQPVDYLKRLEDKGGAVCVVAPGSRLPLLWHELLGRSKRGGIELELRSEAQSVYVAHASGQRALALISWPYLLDELRAAFSAENDEAGLEDVAQLRGLAARMDSPRFLPMTPADITAPTPRIVLQLCDLAVAVADRLVLTETASRGTESGKKLYLTSGPGWHGPYLRFGSHFGQLRFDSDRWAHHGLSPMWLRIAGTTWRYPAGIEHFIAAAANDTSWVEERAGSDPGLWIALPVLLGHEFEDVVQDMTEQVTRIVRSLPGSTAIPPAALEKRPSDA